MSYWRCVLAILRKDISVELRARESLVGVLVFALLTAVIFSFALDMTRELAWAVLPGALWISYFFAGTLGLQRFMSNEEHEGRLWGLMLAPVDRSAIFVAKLLGSMLLMGVVELVGLPLFIVLMDCRPDGPWWLMLPTLVLGAWGFAAIGALVAGVASNSRLAQLLLPLIMFPLLIPVALGAVKLTGMALCAMPLDGMAAWLRVLVAYDMLFTAVAFILYEQVLEV